MSPTLRHLAALILLAAPSLRAQPPTTPTSTTSPPATDPPAKSVLPPLPQWAAPDDAPFLAPIWPERLKVNGRPGIIRDIEGPVRGWNQRWGFTQGLEPSDEDKADAEFLIAALGKSDKPPPIRFEAKGGYVVEFDGKKDGLFAQKVKAVDRPLYAFKYISAEPAGDALELQRTSFVFYEPYADGEKLDGILPFEKCRGVALLMPGLFGTPDTVMDVLVRRLRQERWFVLRLLSASSRFTQTESYTVDPKNLDESADALAHRLGDRAAEIAFAVEAAFAHVLAKRPELAICPRVAIGASAGAITLPTVVARDADKYKAAVFIGGGADFWLINSRSNYRRGVDAVRLSWLGGPPAEAVEQAFDRKYLAAANLDAFHTASALHGKPVLMIHGAIDRAVPAALGDLLWKRLGQPERWVWQVGHEMLFASVAGKLTEISEWLSKAADGVCPMPAPEKPK